MNVHRCMNINLKMIVIISYDHKKTMFLNKLFMDFYGMEHLPKMSHHTMHSPNEGWIRMFNLSTNNEKMVGNK